MIPTDRTFINNALKNLDSGTDGGDVALADVPRTRYQPPVARREPDGISIGGQILYAVGILAYAGLVGWVVVTTIRYGWGWVW